jgi:hypothetical protein
MDIRRVLGENVKRLWRDNLAENAGAAGCSPGQGGRNAGDERKGKTFGQRVKVGAANPSPGFDKELGRTRSHQGMGEQRRDADERDAGGGAGLDR